MVKKLIKFSSKDSYVPTPTPSSSEVPGWYKKLPKYTNNSSRPMIEDVNNSSGQFSNKTVKNCVPYLDSLTTGYVAKLWQDVQVIRTKDGPKISWPVDPQPCSARPEEKTKGLPVPPGCLSTQFTWMSPFIIQTPPGYSVLVTHPLNRFDLPFITLSGVVDADYILGPGHFPFYLKEDFEGIIESGTPIYQIIPFKRESWASKNDKSLVEKSDKNRWNSLAKAVGFYRDNFWHKKSYE